MKTATLSIRLDRDLDRWLTKTSRATGRTRSDLARDLLRRQASLARFEEARRVLVPLATARGFITDEDVFEQVS